MTDPEVGFLLNSSGSHDHRRDRNPTKPDRESSTMKTFLRKLRTRLLSERGNNMVEYALVLALISTGVMAGMNSASASVTQAYTSITSTMADNFGSGGAGAGNPGPSGGKPKGGGRAKGGGGGKSKGGGRGKGGKSKG